MKKLSKNNYLLSKHVNKIYSKYCLRNSAGVIPFIFLKNFEKMFEGDLINGELEIGQVSALINNIPCVQEVFDELISHFNQAKARLNQF